MYKAMLTIYVAYGWGQFYYFYLTEKWEMVTVTRTWVKNALKGGHVVLRKI